MATTAETAAAIARLEADGAGMVLGTVVNPAGLIQAKTVPLRRAAVFADPGLGASPVWHGFAVDRTGIAFSDTPAVGVVGDQRIRIDSSALRAIGDGLAWAPGAFFHQDGTPVACCSRGTLGRVEARLAGAGLEARIGHELEFLLVAPGGSRLPATVWAQYGAAGVLEHEGFVRDIIAAAVAAGVGIDQFHAEFGLDQFEISLSPQSPVASADQLVLTRVIVGRVARKYGLRASFSPQPFPNSVGTGAHQHFSLSQDGIALFSGGKGACGMTSEAEHAVAGLLAGLPDAQAMLCGSILSGLRLRPGNWAGAYCCWGTENREAALRLIRGANPYGANVEVKIVDPSANPYFASAAILGLALDGIERLAQLPPETTVDPAIQTEDERRRAGTVLLPSGQEEVIAALDGSKLLRAILGDDAVDAVVAVRRYEHDNFAGLDADTSTAKFRMAWSV